MSETNIGNSNIEEGGKNTDLLDGIIPPARVVEQSRIESIGSKGGKAITITFTDKWLFTYKEQYLYNQIIQKIKKTKGIGDYILIGEHSDTGRYHLHGVIYFDNIKSITNLQRKLREYGISKIKTIDNSVKWAQYCMKQFDVKV